MGDIRICAITNDMAEKAYGLILPEILEALKEGHPVTAFAAVIDDIAVGALAGVTDGGVFDIASIYVLPEYRRRGVGSALVEWLKGLLDFEDEGKVYIRAEYTMIDEDNETLYPFFLALDFTEDDVDLPMYYCSLLGDINSDDISQGSVQKDSKIISFAEAGKMLLKSASAEAVSGGFPLPEGGLVSEKLDMDSSFCVEEEEKIRAYIAVEPIDEGLIRVSALRSSLSDPRKLMAMLSCSVNAAKKKYPPQTKIAMLALNHETERIIWHIFDDPEACSYRFILLP
ncbi:MAG: GNAT family N-acetyltransferase [Lachnospiraceae bacterium]|nr:GNAT family N-acetyltransferase [Lachnospiraceae bacterium]